MTIAEKYYRNFYKVKEDIKLTNEQWKVVNMMHACLKENNKPKLPQGKMLVDKKQLSEHLQVINWAVKRIDKIYEDKSMIPEKRGSEIAKVRNELELNCHSMKHFQLNIPLEKLNK